MSWCAGRLLNECATTRTPLVEPFAPDFRNDTAAARRARRLRRGIDRWWQDTSLSCPRLRNVALIALTCRSADPEEAAGEIERFWHFVRRTWPQLRYFWWLEFQSRGAPHYHALVVDPPWRNPAAFYRWSNRHWATPFTQRKYETRDRSWWSRNQGDYVKKYAKKDVGGSASGRSQQDYSQAPRCLRTFSSSVKDRSGELLDAHRDRLLMENLAPTWWSWWRRLPYWRAMQKLHHHPAPAGCSLGLIRRPRGTGAPRGRPKRSTAVPASHVLGLR